MASNEDVFLASCSGTKKAPTGKPKADYFRTTEGNHVIAFAGTPGSGASSLHSWDIARMQHKGKPVGKEGMLGTYWHGERSMDPKSDSFKIGAAYYLDKDKGKGKPKAK